ncbi:MAG: L-threonylcarbamoyladenylate synthase [bacterium]
MKDKPRIEGIDPRAPEPALINKAADILKCGGLVIYPTKNLYGLGADAKNPDSVKKVFEIKKRDLKNPVSILIARRQEVYAYAGDISDTAEKIMDRFWPGGITLVFKAKPGLPDILTAGTGTVGIRLPAHPVAAALAKASGCALTATSANLSGAPGHGRIRDIDRAVAMAAGLILDAGTLEPGTGSTIIDVTCEPPNILRHGSVAAGALSGAMK